MTETSPSAPPADPPSDQSGRWEHFAHAADIGLRGYGPTKAAAFAQAATAMTAVITDPADVRPLKAIEIACRAPDDGLLLADWLNALVYEMATRRMLFGRFAVRIEDGALHAIVWGESLEPARHRPAVEVKGATLTALEVAQDAGGWVAACVVDV
jgi:tRNA nucleotidyltransferase (CCA-adding enzyme)